MPPTHGDPAVPGCAGWRQGWDCQSETSVPPQPCQGDPGSEGDTSISLPRSLSHRLAEQWGGKKQKFLEIFTVYKSLFNWFLTLVLPRGC